VFDGWSALSCDLVPDRTFVIASDADSYLSDHNALQSVLSFRAMMSHNQDSSVTSPAERVLPGHTECN